jgi:hypothetical protein
MVILDSDRHGACTNTDPKRYDAELTALLRTADRKPTIVSRAQTGVKGLEARSAASV